MRYQDGDAAQEKEAYKRFEAERDQIELHNDNARKARARASGRRASARTGLRQPRCTTPSTPAMRRCASCSVPRRAPRRILAARLSPFELYMMLMLAEASPTRCDLATVQLCKPGGAMDRSINYLGAGRYVQVQGPCLEGTELRLENISLGLGRKCTIACAVVWGDRCLLSVLLDIDMQAQSLLRQTRMP